MSSGDHSRRAMDTVRPQNDIDICPLEGEAITEAVGERDDGGDMTMEEEAKMPVVLKDPGKPTKDEWDQHVVSHFPFRAWCPHCVRGRGLNSPHPTTAKGAEKEVAFPVISLDYAFPKAAEEDGQMGTILVQRARPLGMTMAMVVPAKGAAHTWVQRRCAQWIDSLGHTKVVMKCDNEPAIVALARDIRANRAEGMETAIEHSPTGESQSNGTAERGIGIIEGVIRTMKDALESRIGTTIPATCKALTWLVEHAAYLYSRCCVGKDGRTPFERWKGRRCKRPLCEFGERILYMPLKAARGGKLDARFAYGTFVGVMANTGEFIVSTDRGAVRARTVRRVPESDRWRREDILNIVGTPWAPEGGDAELPIAIRIGDPKFPAERPPVEPEFELRPRRTYIRKVDILQHGYSERCPGCRAVRLGERAAPHTEACRKRIEEAMKGTADGATRVERAEERITEALAERVAKLARTAEAGSPAAGAGAGSAGDAAAPAQAAPAAPVDADMDVDAPGTSSSSASAPSASSSASAPGPAAPAVDVSMEGEGEGGPDAKRVRLMHVDPARRPTRLPSGAGVTRPLPSGASATRPPSGASLRPGDTLDLTSIRHTGEPRDFSLQTEREEARELISRLQPRVVIGSFSTLMSLDREHMGEEECQEMRRRAAEHLGFCCEVYEAQSQQGRYFVHEHPVVGKETCVRRVMSLNGAEEYIVDMCAYGLTRCDGSGRGRVRRPTRFITNAPEIGKELQLRCPGGHRHVTIPGGKAGAAQVYPKQLCDAVGRGAARQLKRDIEYLAKENTRKKQKDAETLRRRRYVGGSQRGGDKEAAHVNALMHEELLSLWGDQHWDDARGGWLDPALAVKGREEEMKFVHRHRVYSRVPRSVCYQETGKPPIKTGWAETDKGTENQPNVRCRWVAKDFKREPRPELYAATPPLEGVKMILSGAATGPRQGRGVAIIDVRRAYYYALARRRVFVELPAEDWQPGDEDMCGLLRVSLPGTRDAAQNWEEELGECFIQMGLKKGTASPCVYRHHARGVELAVHGDDVTAQGNIDDLEWLIKAMRAKYDIKTQLIGERADLAKEARVLNRTIRWTRQGLEVEADPRHVKVILEQLGLEHANPAPTPVYEQRERSRGGVARERWGQSQCSCGPYRVSSAGCPQPGGDLRAQRGEPADDGGVIGRTEDESKGELLSPNAATAYRAVAARMNYLSQDRADIRFGTMAVCAAMAQPREKDMERLKRIGRYLKGRPRAVNMFHWQAATMGEVINAYSDADWGGDRDTRRSVSGGCLMIGSHCVKNWAKKQQVVALSSAESELYAGLRAGTEGLGLQSIGRDLGKNMSVKLHLDSQATLCLLCRRGLGRAKHIELQHLWLQEAVKGRRIATAKVRTEDNPADLMTKALTRERIEHLMGIMGYQFT